VRLLTAFAKQGLPHHVEVLPGMGKVENPHRIGPMKIYSIFSKTWGE
jgi:hypothetical protein